jgi:hypothetical protein
MQRQIAQDILEVMEFAKEILVKQYAGKENVRIQMVQLYKPVKNIKKIVKPTENNA